MDTLQLRNIFGCGSAEDADGEDGKRLYRRIRTMRVLDDPLQDDVERRNLKGVEHGVEYAVQNGIIEVSLFPAGKPPDFSECVKHLLHHPLHGYAPATCCGMRKSPKGAVRAFPLLRLYHRR